MQSRKIGCSASLVRPAVGNHVFGLGQKLAGLIQKGSGLGLHRSMPAVRTSSIRGRALVIGTGPVGHRVNERSGLVEDARPEIGQPIHLGEPVVHVAQGHGHVVIRIRACAREPNSTTRSSRST